MSGGPSDWSPFFSIQTHSNPNRARDDDDSMTSSYHHLISFVSSSYLRPSSMLRTAMKIQKTSYHGSHEIGLKSQKLLELAVNTQDCAKKIGDLFCKRVFPQLAFKDLWPDFGTDNAQLHANRSFQEKIS